MRRAAASALFLLALLQGICSAFATWALWREVSGLDPISTYAGLPFLVLGFPWCFATGLIPNDVGGAIGMGVSAAINFALLTFFAARVWNGHRHKQRPDKRTAAWVRGGSRVWKKWDISR